MARDLAIVLSSGSINSAVTAALAAQKYRIVLAHVHTAQPSAHACATAHQKLADIVRPYRQVLLPMPSMDPADMPATDHLQLPSLQTRLKLLLPLLGIGYHLALSVEAQAVYCGLRVGSDSEGLARGIQIGQIYSELLHIMAGEPGPELVMPLLEMEMHQVIDLGSQIRAPLEASWSCLQSGSVPCAQCLGCRLRVLAFAQAQRPDPLPTVP